jgi:alanyl-tRNA synthetase
MRRVEALVGEAGYAHFVDLRRRLEESAGALRTQPDNMVAAASALMDRVAGLEERLSRFEDQARTEVAAAAAATADDGLVVCPVPDMSPNALRTVGKAALVGAVSADLVDRGVSAAEIISGAARTLGGGGSRDPALAQAGGPHGDRLDAALEEARTAARSALRGA